MELVHYEQKGNLAYVTLNRPEAMNAFNYDMLVELGQITESIRINPDIRVVIFTGAGDRAFSVGADLKERKTLTEIQVKRNVFKIGEVFSSVASLPQPTIAMMNGYAFGGGMELALACDFRIASEESLMGLTETSLAIIPGAGWHATSSKINRGNESAGTYFNSSSTESGGSVRLWNGDKSF